MINIQQTLAGLAYGCIFALAGMGLVLTYKATGVFNFAHGAIAMIVAYLFYVANADWGLPVGLAAVFAVLIGAPFIGFVLERFIFRPLQRKGATTSEKLVATLGVFLVLLGGAFTIFTGKVRTAPRLISNHALHPMHNVVIGVDQVSTIVLTVAIAAALALLFKRTHLGVEIRAVVDRRELAELASVNANRVAGLSWVLGCCLAGLTGVLLVQGSQLDPIHLTLLVIETFSIAVVAGLTSLPMAAGAGILLLGVLSSWLLPWEPKAIFGITVPSWFRTDLDLIKPNLSVIILFIALVVLRNLDEPADSGGGRTGLVSAAIGRRRKRGPVRLLSGAGVVAFAVLLPYLTTGTSLGRAQQMLALILIFASIVCITGFCGYITLGQAGFAGFGAYLTGRFVNSGHVPVVLAMLIGGVGALALGIVAGYPALKRRGLFLGLTTLSVGLLAYDVVFNNDTFKTRGLKVPRPSMFGLSLGGDHAFYYFELVVLGLLLLVARNLRSGRLGRILAAMRDSEVAAQAIGIELRRYKLLIFAISAFIAGIGGSLLTMQNGIFSADTFHPINASLMWFTVVIVAGVSTLSGAVVGGAVFVLLDVVVHRAGASQLIIAILALSLGYLPGGSLIGLARHVAAAFGRPRTLQLAFEEARRRPAPRAAVNGSGPALPGAGPDPVDAPVGAGLAPSPFAHRLLEGAPS